MKTTTRKIYKILAFYELKIACPLLHQFFNKDKIKWSKLDVKFFIQWIKSKNYLGYDCDKIHLERFSNKEIEEFIIYDLIMQRQLPLSLLELMFKTYNNQKEIIFLILLEIDYSYKGITSFNSQWNDLDKTYKDNLLLLIEEYKTDEDND